MADDDRRETDEREPSLELPSLRATFRRGRRPPTTLTEEPTPPPAEEQAARPRRRPIALRLPRHLPGPLAAVVTGALAGLALVGLTWAGLRGCTSLRGTSSCGTPGVLVLLVIAALTVVLGSVLLRLAGVAAAGSTSLLGVALLVVVVLLALLPVLDQAWVVVVIPLTSACTFAGSWWVTTTYADV